MPELNPLPSKIIVEIISERDQEIAEAEAVTKRSGILVPPPKDSGEKVYGAPTQGIVYAIGSEAAEKLDGVKVGDHVIYRELKPKGFNFDDKKLLALTADQIVAVVEPDNE